MRPLLVLGCVLIAAALVQVRSTGARRVARTLVIGALVVAAAAVPADGRYAEVLPRIEADAAFRGHLAREVALVHDHADEPAHEH